MKRTCISILILALLAVLIPTQAVAQSIDEKELKANGWQQADEGLWQRQTADGTVQRLAYGNGKMLMVPRLRAEIDHVLASFNDDPTADKAKALENLSSQLALLLSPTASSVPPSKVGPCTPWTYVDYNLDTGVWPPPGAHGFMASASAYWDGNGLPCPGHTYNRASYSLSLTAGGTVSDLDWCVDDDNFEGYCWAFVTSTATGPFSSCTMDAYSYLSLFDGVYVLDESKHHGSCY